MAKGISVPVTQSGLEASIQQGVKNIGKVNIPINVDPSAFKNLTQPLGRVSGLATEFEKSIAASNARVLAFGASVGIINGVQNAFSELVKTGVDVQKTLADIAAISGKSGQELSKFGDELFNTAKNTSQSFKTAAQAALEFSRQGLSTEETLKRTNDALTLTRFTTLNAAEAVDVLTAAANSFSETGITTAQIINKLIAVDTKFAVSAEDLANGLARAGSIAQEVGVNFDELNAAITIAQERTARGGAVIGNALKTIFTRLRSDETVQALRDIGVESLNAQGGLKGAIPILQEVATKIQNLGGGERVQVLEAVASKYNINILSALLDDLNNANSKFSEAVNVSSAASNQAYERQVELNKTLAAQINNTTVSVTQLFNKLAEIGVTENLANLLKFVNNLLDGFNKLLDSEGTGGNIAKGIIKGLSDVFFTIGLPIIGAIFIKLTKDIAQFGVESLKTILGINQQVKERQALEQAVVNTLIRDQEVLSTILALSGNRTKQEEYLLSVYNRQLSALQQVQNIAASVTPGLVAGGLSATSGQIRKRAAGGYLPSQEASDVRRGVGGASPSSSVVTIPNFAFGGGKRGTMIANTSEYIVPNFANGGSAIFNRDMVSAYGLPAGAKKISAAGGYIPNFASAEFTGKYAGIVPSKVAGDPIKTGRAKNGKLYSFPMIYAGSSAQSKDNIDEIRNEVIKVSQNLAVRAATDYATAFDPDLATNSQAVAQKATQANQNKGAIESFVGSIFEASIASLLDDAYFKESQERSAISTFDFTNNSRLQKIFGIPNGVKFLEAKNNAFEGNLNKIAEKISKVESGGAAFSQKRPTLQNSNKPARYFYEGEQGYLEQEPGIFKEANLSQYKLGPNQEKTGLPKGARIIRGAMGYIPNFAGGNPLADAIKREMAAGINPSQIRITQDGRLKNSQNPNGLAVINTRDEPNGKIPNFNQRLGRKKRRELAQQSVANPDAYSEPIGPQLPQQSANISAQANDFNSGLLKTTMVFGALQSATYAFEASLKNTDSAILQFSKSITDIGSKAALGATLGEGFKPILGSIGESLSKSEKGWAKTLGGFTSSLSGAVPIIGAVAGGLSGLFSILEEYTTRNRREGQKEGQKFGESLAGKTLEDQRKSLEDELASLAEQEQEAVVLLSNYKSTVNAVQQSMGGMGGGIGFGAAVVSQTPKEEQASANIEKVKGRAEEVRRLLENVGKQEKATANQKEAIERKAAEDLRVRVALSEQLGKINIGFAKGEASILTERAKAYAKITENSTNLTETEKRQQENNLKIQEAQQKINDIGKDSLKDLVKEIADKSKLANIDKDVVESLIKRFEIQGDNLDLEKEAQNLGIQGANNLKALLLRSKENAEVTKIKLDAEKAALETAIKASEYDALRTSQLKNQLAVINETYATNQKIEDSRIRAAREQAEFDRASGARNLRFRIQQKGFATPQEQGALANLEAISKYQIEQQKIEDDLAEARKTNLREVINGAFSQIESSDAVSATIKTQIAAEKERITTVEELQQVLKRLNPTQQKDKDAVKAANAITEKRIELLRQLNTESEGKATRRREEIQDPTKTAEFLQNSVRGSFGYGITLALNDIRDESNSFSETFGKNTTVAFRDGLRDALSAAVSQTDDLNGALQNVAMNFLKTMQNAFLQQASNSAMMGIKSAFPSVFNFAKGGLVSGGSGYRDDVPAMLTGGEFVMRKSAVQKYGAENLRKMNNGGIFLPGVRGGGAISGYDALRAFANQTTTSGSTDILRGGGSSAFINLEDQSARLSRYALLGDDTINQEIRSAQEQGLNIIQQREAYRTQQRKAFQQQLVGTIASAALSAGIGALGRTSGFKPGQFVRSSQTLAGVSPYKDVNITGGFNYGPTSFGGYSTLMSGVPFKAYGGMIRRYASGGPVDDVPALLMSGEYVMNRQSTSKYGRRLLDSMNQGRLTRFADGGEVGGETTTTTESNAKMMGDVSININVSGGASQAEAQGNTNQGGIDYKKMSERIKAVVIETINEEKRLGGSLRTR